MSKENTPAFRRRRILWRLVAGVAVVLTAVCLLQFWWKGLEVARALDGVTRLRVRSGGACHRRPEDERTLYETSSPEEIRSLASSVRFGVHLVELSCQCCGRPTLEFYRGETLVLAMSIHHGKAVRVLDHWWTDAPLSSGSREELKDWLAAKGITAESLREHP